MTCSPAAMPRTSPRAAPRRAPRPARRGARGSGRACGAGGGRARRGRGSPRTRAARSAPCPGRRGTSRGGPRSTQVARDDEPAEPQRGRERLARRAGVDDPLGLEPLERADRRRGRSGTRRRSRPRSRSRRARAASDSSAVAALGGEDDAGRVLVGGRDDDGVDVAASSSTRRPCSSTRHRDRLQPGARGDLALLAGCSGPRCAIRCAPRVGQRAADDALRPARSRW